MAKKNITLLLNRSVENLGIVGDVVKVKSGYARNYLVPHGIAEVPTPTRIEALKEQRAAAQSEQSALRSAREELLSRMGELEISMTRSCNDQGVLYGSVTQRDIADALQEAGYDVGTRSVRLKAAFRRVGQYEVPIQFDKDLRTEVALVIKADHALEEEVEETEDKGGDNRDGDRDDRPQFRVPKEANLDI